MSIYIDIIVFIGVVNPYEVYLRCFMSPGLHEYHRTRQNSDALSTEVMSRDVKTFFSNYYFSADEIVVGLSL